MRYIVGIDVGGTNVVVGVVAEDGSEAVGVVSEPTLPEQGPDAVVERIVKLARASMAKAKGREIAGVGIGSPGPLDTKSGVVLLTPNLGWTNMPLRDRIAQALDLPATLDNDANCAIFGEWWRGAARGVDHRHGDRRRYHPRRQDLPRRVGRRRRAGAHDHQREWSPLQVRQ